MKRVPRGQHWSKALREQVIRQLQVPGSVPTEVARELGLCERSLRRFALSLRKEGILKDREAAFTAPILPSADVPMNELLTRRREESRRVLAADEARKLVPVQVHTPGPIGLLVFGDPHIDDPGCDFVSLEYHLNLAARRQDYVFAGNIGDLHNNWVGRLHRLYASQETTERDAWRLVQWMMRDAGVSWLFLIRGNHDYWSGQGDPLKFIMQGAQCAVDEPHGVRIGIAHPNGAVTRVHARHDFKGHSMYHDLHALKRELSFGHRDHLLVAGHRHVGGDEGTITPEGNVAQLVRVCGYKAVDSYAKQNHFPPKRIHQAALVLIDPDKPDDDRGRVWCAPTVEEGMEYLDWKRKVFNGKPIRRR